MSVETALNHVMKKYKTNCPFKIAEEIGIQVIFEDLGKTLGYYHKNYRIKLIHINESASENKKKFICAHELGHALLHPDANTPFLKSHTFYSTDKIEIEANRFAIGLLFASDYTYDQVLLKEAVHEYGIPRSLIHERLQPQKI
ncbi:ImmA/IrrE family metallo-endopeptidase [Jeotgalibacillus terrae]|uniref:ImmA/IrrE family metallo-endopeptidase n=1 Tax=Jeotgalibacillus terrae TaxID=587735 RepID=A0ABW5ZH18_9BACL|nr:ImmA/IrrE family metallo-endopeptidase [Jeotgalibacillus terrae]MBM7580065.1 Zn-dependent peptidase ImmA (M78 family) [Jeotgalibacillus terrae]